MTAGGGGEVFRLGYLVPAFPGQTHGFFWRETEVLAQLGLAADIVSTRGPARNVSGSDWAGYAASITTYLAPHSLASALSILGELRSTSGGQLAGILRQVAEMSREGAPSPLHPVRLRSLMVHLMSLLLGVRLTTVAKKRGWQHLHVHSCGNAALVALYARFLSGLPYSLTLHGPLGDYGSNQVAKWANAAFALIITEELHSQVQSVLGTAAPATVEVVPMGVNPRELTRSKAYVPWSPPEAFRIFSCGRLNPSKGHDVLIKAVNTMILDGLNVQLTIAGEDEEGGRGYRRELERLIGTLGLNHSVRLLGSVSGSSIRTQLDNAHVFALASHAEPLGVAIMEAMCMGVPIVATASGGVPELVRHDETGILVTPGDPEALRNALVRLQSDPSLCVTFGSAGRTRVTSLFGHRRSAETLARLATATVHRDGGSTLRVTPDGR